MHKVVFFDLDGTLSDYKAACDVILTKLWQDHPTVQEASEARFKRAYWRFFQEKEDEQREGKIEVLELQNRERRFANVLGRMGFADEAIETLAPSMADGYDRYRQTSASLYPNVRRTLETVKRHVPIGVITQGRDKSQRGQMERIGIIDLIDHICVSEEVGHTKPSLELYRACFERAGVEASEVIMVGDRLDWDLEPAHALGATTIVYTENSLYYHPGQEQHEAIDHMARNHDELLPLLLRLLGVGE